MTTKTLDSSVLTATSRPEDDLAERLVGHIEIRSWGQIRDLQVVCSGGEILLLGWTRTYHAKQLAQEAVLDLAGGGSRLANQIEVC